MYYAVFYATDGTIHLWPNESKDECEQKLLRMLEKLDVYERCDRTTIIKREIVDGNKYIFGCPKSLNMKERIK